ncbi:hypothetical protein NA57DRAFT_34974 [Rhizodiscina lignyota]|uniref:Uncharacterized protein n=1 Tax=Rhizodiscina lignyota TaxID=1504668 RepID=A0A9P4ILL8_9PEZI|nr:hypothetical protein NA57DRAFT_34974 [Rhizodiscina lignyota]
MEAAIRWSPHPTALNSRFIIVDVAGNRLRLCELGASKGKAVGYKQICQRDRLPNFTAFDWSKTQDSLVAIGAASGEATLVQLDSTVTYPDSIRAFPIKHQRKCNSIAFSTNNLLATGLDRVRNDCCMNIYDLAAAISPGRQQEPYRKLASSEAIMSIKFFAQQPDTLIAGVSRQCIRLYDLRDPTGNVSQLPTRQVHNLAIDPLDENYFVSAGPSGEPIVSVWDKRFTSSAIPGTPSGGLPGPIVEFRPAVDTAQSTSIWSLRFSGTQKGVFGVLSSAGEIKIIELAHHSGSGTTLSAPANPHGGSAWSSRTYASYTHNLTYPWYQTEHRHDENMRIIAYDFMSAGNPIDDHAAVALHPDRAIQVFRIPSKAGPLKMTALDELYAWGQATAVVRPMPNYSKVASDLEELQMKTLPDHHSGTVEESTSTIDAQVESLRLSTSIKSMDTHLSSREAHCHLLNMNFPESKLSFEDMLRLQTVQRRRCLEGYLFNPTKNKDIVANDPWLVDLWDTVRRFHDLAKDSGMSMNGIDLSYLGIFSILSNSLGLNSRNRLLGSEKHAEGISIRVAIRDLVARKGYYSFKGVKSSFPEHRQLCLLLCGWTFHKERLRARCLELVEADETYKAIALCVFRGYKDLALELLKTAVKQKRIQNIGLGAVIACDSVDAEQRELCRWMSDETDDPYLKAMMEYFVSGDWARVANMKQLALVDRVSVALKYFEDDRLQEFIKLQMSEAIVYSNIEGIVLTGLVDKGMDLFEHYIRKHNDIQTPVLVMAHTVPLYLKDSRFDAWKETYFMQMQAWRAFTQRTRFTVLHNRMSVTRDSRQLIKPPDQRVSLRCLHCQQNLAYHPQKTVPDEMDGDTTTITTSLPRPSNTPSMNAGTICPHCKRPMPRCGICMLWLGSPDPARPGGAAALAEKSEGKPKEAMALEKMTVWCMNCNHGFHGGHAREWFARHRLCAVPDCGCHCGVLH